MLTRLLDIDISHKILKIIPIFNFGLDCLGRGGWSQEFGVASGFGGGLRKWGWPQELGVASHNVCFSFSLSTLSLSSSTLSSSTLSLISSLFFFSLVLVTFVSAKSQPLLLLLRLACFDENTDGHYFVLSLVFSATGKGVIVQHWLALG